MGTQLIMHTSKQSSLHRLKNRIQDIFSVQSKDAPGTSILPDPAYTGIYGALDTSPGSTSYSGLYLKECRLRLESLISWTSQRRVRIQSGSPPRYSRAQQVHKCLAATASLFPYTFQMCSLFYVISDRLDRNSSRWYTRRLTELRGRSFVHLQNRVRSRTAQNNQDRIVICLPPENIRELEEMRLWYRTRSFLGVQTECKHVLSLKSGIASLSSGLMETSCEIIWHIMLW